MVRRYAETIVDNSNNTIELSYTETVAQVNSDGSYQADMVGSGDPSDTVNGTAYFIPTEAQTVNVSGQLTREIQTLGADAFITCTFEPHGGGPDFPVRVGQTWRLDFTVSCGSDAPVAYTQTGTVADVETVTVPAGIYSTLKIQSTLNWTDAKGTTHTLNETTWRDIATSISVKQSSTSSYGGTLPTNGYAVSHELVLQSYSD